MMFFKKMPFAAAITCCALAGVAVTASNAQAAYPDKPIDLVVPFPAGGGVDLTARFFAEQLTKDTGANVVVENRAGAGGIIGVNYVVHSQPNGYTLTMGSPGNISIAPGLYPKLSYDPDKDLQAVAMGVQVPVLLVVRPDAPFTDVKSLIAYGKANPGKLSYGSGGPGTSQHLAGAMFAETAHIQALHVPYKGTAPALTDLMAGRIDYMFTDSSAMSIIKGGKIKLMAVAGAKRSTLLPDVPTVAESGLPGFEVANWYGFFIAAHTPSAVTAWLNSSIEKAMKNPTLIKKLNDQMLEVAPAYTPDQFAAFLRSDTAKWSKLVKSMGITLD
jgi:tripartite-type tricarboxylate transporter receptor subunit TctC